MILESGPWGSKLIRPLSLPTIVFNELPIDVSTSTERQKMGDGQDGEAGGSSGAAGSGPGWVHAGQRQPNVGLEARVLERPT